MNIPGANFIYTKTVAVSFQKEDCIHPTKGTRMLHGEFLFTSVWQVLGT